MQGNLPDWFFAGLSGAKFRYDVCLAPRSGLEPSLSRTLAVRERAMCAPLHWWRLCACDKQVVLSDNTISRQSKKCSVDKCEVLRAQCHTQCARVMHQRNKKAAECACRAVGIFIQWATLGQR